MERPDYIEGLNLQVSIRTTSDWTLLESENSAISFLNQKIIKDAPDLKILGFSINKRPYDSTEVNISYEILISHLPVKEALIFCIKKGDIGRTEVTFMSEDQVIGKFENALNIKEDPANKKIFLVEKESLSSCNLIKQQITYPECPKLVLAFYYPWYGNPEGPHKRWVHWQPDRYYASVHTPALGYYDSADTLIIRKHIDFAKDAGIDGFIISWWGKESSSDTVTARIFEEAEKANFNATIYYEDAGSVEDVISDIKYILRKYGELSSFLKIQGKPIIFYYGRVVNKFTPNEWKYIFSQTKNTKFYPCNIAETMDSEMLSVFDGFHIYNNMEFESVAWLNQGLNGTAHIQGKIFCATILPGYNDTLIRIPGKVIDRKNGEYYRKSWEASLKTNPDIILITSFNEWHEGTEIEPSEECGRAYLDITREYANVFRISNAR